MGAIETSSLRLRAYLLRRKLPKRNDAAIPSDTSGVLKQS